MADYPSEGESSDSEVEENLKSSSDSNAETNQSDASNNEDIHEDLEELTLSDQSDAELTTSQETAHGKETPPQKRDSCLKTSKKNCSQSGKMENG